jgi:hypothetical protein
MRWYQHTARVVIVESAVGPCVMGKCNWKLWPGQQRPSDGFQFVGIRGSR